MKALGLWARGHVSTLGTCKFLVRTLEATLVDELREVLLPPERPFFADGDWAAVEVAVGTPLPADYKAFIATYGAGWISNGLVIHSPFIWAAQGRDIRQAWADWASMYQDFAEYGGVEMLYPVFPQPGGLLPFGSLADFHVLNWLTVGEPEGWPFVYYHRDHGFFEIKGLSAVEFILEAVTQRSPLLKLTGSESLFTPPCVFRPYTGEEQSSAEQGATGERPRE
jgi:hypothetical protein